MALKRKRRPKAASSRPGTGVAASVGNEAGRLVVDDGLGAGLGALGLGALRLLVPDDRHGLRRQRNQSWSERLRGYFA